MRTSNIFLTMLKLLPLAFFQGASAQLWKSNAIRTVSSTSMRAIVVDKPGPPESMRVAYDYPVPQLLPGQVLIQVAYAGLNRGDLLQRMGRYPAPPGESTIMGLEVSGVVRKVSGSGGSAGKFRPGDRVMALLAGGGYADFVNASAEMVMRLPSGSDSSLNLRDAAALPEAWLTAYQLLHLVGNFVPGQRLLVHAGASGVGTAAIQLARQFGAGDIYATAGSEAKCRFAERLGAVRCFDYRSKQQQDGEDKNDWSAQLLAATGGAGVDLLLDCVGTGHLRGNLKSLARDGRWVLYGLLGGADLPPGEAAGFLGELLRKRASLVATLLRDRPKEYKARLVSEFKERALPLFASGQLRPVIDSEFPMSDAAAAHAKMQSNANIGKILLAINPQLELDSDKQEL